MNTLIERLDMGNGVKLEIRVDGESNIQVWHSCLQNPTRRLIGKAEAKASNYTVRLMLNCSDCRYRGQANLLPADMHCPSETMATIEQGLLNLRELYGTS